MNMSPMLCEICDEYPRRPVVDFLRCTCRASNDCTCGARLRQMFVDHVPFNRVKLLTRMDRETSDESLLASSSTHIWPIKSFSNFCYTNTRAHEDAIRKYWDSVPLVDNFLLCDVTYLATDKKIDLQLALSRSINDITVVIFIHSTEDRPLFTRLEFALVKTEMEKETKTEETKTIESKTLLTYDLVCETGINTARVSLMKRWNILNVDKEWIVNDTITLSITARARFLASMTKLEIPECHDDIIINVGTLLSTGKFSDIIIKASDGVEIKAHKAIITSRSEYFASMLNHENISETQDSLIQISDFNSGVVYKMLYYLYTGEANDIEDCAMDLIALADKYNMTDLHSVCEDFFIDNLNGDNALDALRIAEVYNAKILVVKARKFIVKNSKTVMTGDPTELGNTLKALDSESLGDIMIGIAAISARNLKNASRRDFDNTPQLITNFNTMEHLRDMWIDNITGAETWHGKPVRPARLLTRYLKMGDVRVNMARWFRDNSS